MDLFTSTFSHIAYDACVLAADSNTDYYFTCIITRKQEEEGLKLCLNLWAVLPDGPIS